MEELISCIILFNYKNIVTLAQLTLTQFGLTAVLGFTIQLYFTYKLCIL